MSRSIHGPRVAGVARYISWGCGTSSHVLMPSAEGYNVPAAGGVNFPVIQQVACFYIILGLGYARAGHWASQPIEAGWPEGLPRT
ncbi:hypothetical protein VFPFJ_00603 [Purpureocillium lilacinum]|uniref:Uncharacterized protein n=1 Tax=Purpureocillium lilacinum TaxID=33203 RepID=A0A179H9C9_PURLI|nr:hypothetical protein VFPFJ_00603 [Purpureocillium lilacinum]OAQ86532.1 hypothetical protein VFPBJ_00572 [Purpureocillium lilacinum]OAQ94494.1 hypothetical protein VFPFJ_00603 [Purpureocillium lilacinum]